MTHIREISHISAGITALFLSTIYLHAATIPIANGNTSGQCKLYISDTVFHCDKANHIKTPDYSEFSKPYDCFLYDTLRWLDNIGTFSHILVNNNDSNINITNNKNLHKLTFELVSFNGNPISIRPLNVKLKPGLVFIRNEKANRFSKVLQIRTSLLQQKYRTPCFNLFGCKPGLIRGSQHLIQNNEPTKKH